MPRFLRMAIFIAISGQNSYITLSAHAEAHAQGNNGHTSSNHACIHVYAYTHNCFPIYVSASILYIGVSWGDPHNMIWQLEMVPA